MKLAYMYATPDVGHHQVTAIRGPAEEVLPFLRRTGYSGVEFLVRDVEAMDQDAVACVISGEGLDVPAICTGEVYGEDGLSFADPNPELRRVAVDRMLAAMEFAARFGAMVNVGRLRGRFVDGVAPEQTMDWIREAFVACASRHPETRIVLEPVNRNFANCMMGTAEAVDFVRDIGMENVGIMLDVAHMLIEQEEPAASMDLARPWFWHYHITDSDRLPVGAGSWDIDAIMAGVRASGFDAYVTAEHFQVLDGPSSAVQTYRRLAHHFS